jgi:DNA-binding NarL/FixJ family response regulator
VQNHVQNTLNKLRLHNRVELIRYPIEHGLDAGQGLGRPGPGRG